MGYIYILVVLLTLLSGTYLNSILTNITDFNMLGNTQTYLTSGDKYKQYIDLQFKENTTLLEDIEPIYNQMLKDILKIKINKSGQSTNLMGAIPVGEKGQNAVGAYESEYNIKFQGYQIDSNEFNNTMSFSPLTNSSLYRCPIPLTFEGTYQNDYVVMKYNPRNNINSNEVMFDSSLNEIIQGIRQANSSGVTPNFNSNDIELFQQSLKNPKIAQIFQSSIQKYYCSLSEKSNIFTDNSSVYLTDINKDLILDSYGELQWIYDELIKLGYDNISASKMVFVANIAFMVEHQSMLIHNQNYKVYNAWTYYKEMDLASEIKDVVYKYIDSKSKDTISPLMMFTSIKIIDDSYLINSLMEANINNILSELKIDVSKLVVRDDLLATLYILLTEDKLTKNNKSSNNINDFKINEVNALSLVSKYRISNDSNFKQYIKSIVVKPQTKVIAEAFSIYMSECSSDKMGEYLTLWSKVNPLSIISKHSVSRAFFEYISHIATQDLQNIKINYFTSNNITYLYMFPYMATGELLLQILEETQKQMSYNQLGNINYNESVYFVYSNFDKEYFESNHNGKSLTANQSFLKNRIENGVIQPIVVGAYKSSGVEESFNFNYCLWNEPNWKDNEHYVNLYSTLYNNVSIDELEQNGGRVSIDKSNLLTWFNSLTDNTKKIQQDKAIDYSIILKEK